MSKRKVKRKKEKRPFSPFRFAAIILAIILAINFFSFIASISSSSSRYAYEYSDLDSNCQKYNYPELSEDIIYNKITKIDTRQDTSEFSYLSDYYRAAFRAKAFEETGDLKTAQEEKELMASLKEKITDSSILSYTQDIDKIFNQ